MLYNIYVRKGNVSTNGGVTCMNKWLHATKNEIDNMTLKEAQEIIQKHIDLGLYAMEHPNERSFAPRYHMTKALMMLMEEVNKHSKVE